MLMARPVMMFIKIDSMGGDFRYGRTFIPPVYGPELSVGEVTIVPFYIQFYDDGANFVTHTNDSSSGYYDEDNDADVAPLPPDNVIVNNHTGNLAAVNFVVGDVNLPLASTAVSQGLGRSVEVDRPGPNNDGSVEVTFDVDPWLQFSWDGGADIDPTTIIHFGSFRGHDRIIYRREVTQ